MPLTLTTPLVTTIAAHQIRQIEIDLENNKHLVTVADLDSDGVEIHRYRLTLPIFDDLGTIIMPSAWPETNPTGQQMYILIKQFIFLGLQEQRGEYGLGPGVIS